MSSLNDEQRPVNPGEVPPDIIEVVPSLEDELMTAGWRPGIPRHLTRLTQRLDAWVCRLLKCPQCLRRGMENRPWHRDRRYRIIAECSWCRTQVEM
jgi:hypothetical protein